MSDTESDEKNMKLSNLNMGGDVVSDSNFRLTENNSQTKDMAVKTNQDSYDSWEESVHRFGGGDLELLTATFDSNDLRKLGIPPGATGVKVRIVGGVLLINPA